MKGGPVKINYIYGIQTVFIYLQGMYSYTYRF